MSEPIPANAVGSVEAAEITGLSVPTISGLVTAGYLKAWLVKPKKYLIDLDSLMPIKALRLYTKPTEYSESAHHPHPAKHAAMADAAGAVGEEPVPVVVPL